MYKYSRNYFYLKGIKNQQPKSTKNRYFFEQILMTIFEHPTRRGNLRTDGIIQHIINTQPIHFSSSNDLSSYPKS